MQTGDPQVAMQWDPATGAWKLSPDEWKHVQVPDLKLSPEDQAQFDATLAKVQAGLASTGAPDTLAAPTLHIVGGVGAWSDPWTIGSASGAGEISSSAMYAAGYGDVRDTSPTPMPAPIQVGPEDFTPFTLPPLDFTPIDIQVAASAVRRSVLYLSGGGNNGRLRPCDLGQDV